MCDIFLIWISVCLYINFLECHNFVSCLFVIVLICWHLYVLGQTNNLQWALASVPLLKALQLTLSFLFWYAHINLTIEMSTSICFSLFRSLGISQSPHAWQRWNLLNFIQYMAMLLTLRRQFLSVLYNIFMSTH